MKYKDFVIKTDGFGSDYKNDYKNAYRRMFLNSVRSAMAWRILVLFRKSERVRIPLFRIHKLLICLDLYGLWTGGRGCPSRPGTGIKKRNPYGGKCRGCVPKWSLLGSNQGPADYESAALTD